MTAGYTRKKQPEVIRRALLDHAARIVTEQGLANLTVQAVAEAAGVTKGGLFHHFPSKQALVDGVLCDWVERLDAEIDALMAADPEPHGRFTRAYVAAAFADHPAGQGGGAWAAVSLSMMADTTVSRFWTDWLSARLDRHRDTDGGPEMEVVRLAADGAWLALLLKADATLVAGVPDLRARLTAMTRRG